MRLHIGEAHTTLGAADGGALLSPELLDQIVRAVVARLQQERAREAREAADRRLDGGRLVGGAE